MNIWLFSRSVGAGSATTRNTRGLTRSVSALIVPPLPALSRPSNTTQTLAPDDFTHSCIATSSACSVRSSASYSLRFIFGRASSPSGFRVRVTAVNLLRRRPDATCAPAADLARPVTALLVRCSPDAEHQHPTAAGGDLGRRARPALADPLATGV